MAEEKGCTMMAHKRGAAIYVRVSTDKQTVDQLRAGKGINKVAREVGVGTGTVQRIAREIGSPFDAAA